MTFDPPAARSALVVELQRRTVRDAPWDRAELALLRRTLRRLPRHADPYAVALVAPYCGAARDTPDAALLTACLWAVWHRDATTVESDWNLGHALRALPYANGERAWRSLCATTDATLPQRMTNIVADLADYGVATDWHRLHRDLRSWYQGFHHPVLRRWFTGLFGPAPSRSAAPPLPSHSEVSSS